MKNIPLIIITFLLFSFFVIPSSIFADEPIATLTGHTDIVYSVEFSPDGNMLATKGRDESIRLWNPHSGSLIRSIDTNSRRGIAFNQNGSILASAEGTDKVVNLWNTDTGKLQKTLGGHLGDVYYVTFSPDGDVLASGDSDGNIILWNSDTGQLLRTWHADTLEGLTFSADGSFLANGGRDDANVKVWNANSGELLHTIEPSAQEIFDVAFSPEGLTLASVGWGHIDLWDANTAELIRSLPADRGRIYLSAAFSPDGRILACGKDAGVSLWDAKRGIFLKNFRVVNADVYDLAFSPDGRTLASVGKSNEVHLWDISPLDTVIAPEFPEDLTGPNVNTWHEDFGEVHLDSWTKREYQRERVTWQTKNGQLEVFTEPFCNGRLNISNQLELVTNYTLEFTAFPIETEQIRVKLKVDSLENANAGIFIGNKPDSLVKQVFQHAYLFANHTLGNPDSWGHSGAAPEIGLNLKEIDVVFDRGHFYVYSEGDYIVDFRTNSIQTIDYIGIVVFPKNCNIPAAVNLDDFEISGPTIPAPGTVVVEPKDNQTIDDTVIDDFWVEDFNEGHLDSWTEDIHQKERNRVTWQAKDGNLNVWIQPLLNHALRQTYQLEFTGLPIKAEKLNVKVDVLEAHNANVGILIGQYDWTGGTFRRTYKILHKSIWGAVEVDDVPDQNYENLKEIEIDFDKGHFELFSEGEHILEFDEPNLPYIDCLGIIAYTSEVPLAHFVMDNFIISDMVPQQDKSLNVTAKGKAAILWGELKQQ